jgi:hypothetical protein
MTPDRSVFSDFVWKVGETVALVVCGSPKKIVHPSLVFER